MIGEMCEVDQAHHGEEHTTLFFGYCRVKKIINIETATPESRAAARTSNKKFTQYLLGIIPLKPTVIFHPPSEISPELIISVRPSELHKMQTF